MSMPVRTFKAPNGANWKHRPITSATSVMAASGPAVNGSNTRHLSINPHCLWHQAFTSYAMPIANLFQTFTRPTR